MVGIDCWERDSDLWNAALNAGRIAFPRHLLLSADPVNPAQIYGY